MYHWFCEDVDTGEEFLVTADTPEDAEDYMWHTYNMRISVFDGTSSDFEAEASGLDEY